MFLCSFLLYIQFFLHLLLSFFLYSLFLYSPHPFLPPSAPILQLPKECFVNSERGMEGYSVSSVASQPGSSSVGDAWLLDGERASRQGPAVFCLLKRLQTPLSACCLPQSSLRMQNTVPIPLPSNTHPPTRFYLKRQHV